MLKALEKIPGWGVLVWIWNHKKLIAVLAAVGALGYYIWLADSRGKDLADLREDLKVQEAATKNCIREGEISYEVSEEYQGRIAGLDRQLRALRLHYSATCVPVEAPGGPYATPAPGKLPGPHGINAEALLEFAADCERERLKVIGLQDYSRRINDGRP